MFLPFALTKITKLRTSRVGSFRCGGRVGGAAGPYQRPPLPFLIRPSEPAEEQLCNKWLLLIYPGWQSWSLAWQGQGAAASWSLL